MTTQTANGTVPVSLIEAGASWVTKTAAKRRSRPDRRPRGVLSFIGELLGTLVAMALFVAAAFVVVGLGAGLAVAGVAVLLVEAKATIIRRERAGRSAVRR